MKPFWTQKPGHIRQLRRVTLPRFKMEVATRVESHARLVVSLWTPRGSLDRNLSIRPERVRRELSAGHFQVKVVDPGVDCFPVPIVTGLDPENFVRDLGGDASSEIHPAVVQHPSESADGDRCHPA